MGIIPVEIEKSKCLNCGAVQSDLDGVCCKCGWSHQEQRQATVEEMEPVKKKLDDGIATLKKFLDK